MFSKTSIVTFAAVILILSFTLGIVTYNIPYRLGGISILSTYLWAALLFFLCFAYYGSVYLSRSFILVLMYVWVVFLMQSLDHLFNSASTWMTQQVYPVVTAVVFYELFLFKQPQKSLKRVIWWSLGLIFLACVTNSYSLNRFPEAVRLIVGGRAEATELIQYSRFGISGYGFFSALPPLIPILIYLIRKTRSSLLKIFSYLFILFIFVAIVLSTITTPFVLSIIALLFTLLGASLKNRTITIVVVLIMALLFLVIPPQLILGRAFDLMMAISPSSHADLRLNDTKQAILGDFEVTSTSKELTSFESRFQRVYWNLETIARYPFFGSSKTNPPESFHLFWLYLIASFGMIGALPFILLIVYQIRRNARLVNQDYRFYYLTSIAIFIVMGLAKNYAGWLMFLVPMFIAPGVGFLKWDEVTSGVAQTGGYKG